MEYFDPVDYNRQTDGVREVVRRKLDIRTGSFAVLNVGDAVAVCQKTLDIDIRFAVVDNVSDPSHTGVFGYSQYNAATARLLANLIGPGDLFAAGP